MPNLTASEGVRTNMRLIGKQTPEGECSAMSHVAEMQSLSEVSESDGEWIDV